LFSRFLILIEIKSYFTQIIVLDSVGRFPPPGFAEGVFADFGEYDECLHIKSPVYDKKSPIIRGQYCLMKVILPFPLRESVEETDSLDRGLNVSSKYGNNPLLRKLTIRSIIEALNIINGRIYRMGICIPSHCRADQIENMINKSRSKS